MRRPYCLKKRQPQGVYYYKLSSDASYHSTGLKAKAEDYVLQIIKDEITRKQSTDLKSFCKNLFILDKCDWVKRHHSKGKPFSEEMAQMRRGHLTNHILPKFGNRLLDSISVADIDNFLATLKLSNVTKNHVIGTLNIVFSEAVRQDLLAKNPMAAIEPFAKNSEVTDILEPEEFNILFPIDIKNLVKVCGSVRNAAFFTFIYTTGVRIGGAQALTWEMLNFDRSSLVINKRLQNSGKIGRGKTKALSIVPFMTMTSALFSKLKDEIKPKNSSDLIFSNQNGNPVGRGIWLRIYRKVLKESGIDTSSRKIVIHSLRHNFNTRAVEMVDGETVRLMTSHTSKKMTDHYKTTQPLKKSVSKLRR